MPTQIYTLIILCRAKYKVFEVDFTRLWNTTLTIYRFIFRIFKTQKYDFYLKKRITGAHVHQISILLKLLILSNGSNTSLFVASSTSYSIFQL
jgi:hypothetical protein